MRVESTLCGDQPVITNGKFEYQWTDHGSRLRGVVNHMLYSGTMVDVTVACSDGTVKAHQVILAAFSPYFQALFSANPCRHPVVFLHNVNLPVVKALIDFIYQGAVTCSVTDVSGILELARSLQIRGLDHLQRITAGVPAPPSQPSSSFSYSSHVTAQEPLLASPCRHATIDATPLPPAVMPGGAVMQPVHCHHLPGGATLVHHHHLQDSAVLAVSPGPVGPPAPLTLPAETTVRLVTPTSTWLPAPPVHREPEKPHSDLRHQRVPSDSATYASISSLSSASSLPPELAVVDNSSVPSMEQEEPIPLNLSPNRECAPALPLSVTPASGSFGMDSTALASPVASSPIQQQSPVSPSQSSPPEAPPQAAQSEIPVSEEQQVPVVKARRIVKKRKFGSSSEDAGTAVDPVLAEQKGSVVAKRKRGRPRSYNAEIVNFVCLEEEGKSRYNAMYNRKARELGLKSGWTLMEDRVRRTLRGNSKDRSKGIMEKSRMVLKFRIPENLVKLSEGGAYDFYIPDTGARGRIHDPNFSASCRVLTLKGLVRQTQFALKEEQLNYIKEGNMAAASCYGRRAVTESLHVLASLQRSGNIEDLMPEKFGFSAGGKETDGLTITIASSRQQPSPSPSPTTTSSQRSLELTDAINGQHVHQPKSEQQIAALETKDRDTHPIRDSGQVN